MPVCQTLTKSVQVNQTRVFSRSGNCILSCKAFEETVASILNGLESAAADEAFIGTFGVGGYQLKLSDPAVTKHVGFNSVLWS